MGDEREIQVKCDGLHIDIYSHFFIKHNWQSRKISFIEKRQKLEENRHLKC